MSKFVSDAWAASSQELSQLQSSPIRPLIALFFLCAFAPSCVVSDAGAQAPAPTSVWQRVHYPPIPIPGITNGVLTFSVGSGGHTNRPQEEPSHLRFDLQWSARTDVPLPAPTGYAGLGRPDLYYRPRLSEFAGGLPRALLATGSRTPS
jgi:hypothetical protein